MRRYAAMQQYMQKYYSSVAEYRNIIQIYSNDAEATT